MNLENKVLIDVDEYRLLLNVYFTGCINTRFPEQTAGEFSAALADYNIWRANNYELLKEEAS